MAYPTTDQQNAQVAYQYFLGKGLSPAQAAGIVGNLTAESNINPESTNSIGCVGIAQWCGGRKQPNLQTGDPTRDLQTQLDYMWYEMTGPQGQALTALKATSTPADAARAFEATFERSGGALLAQREAYATDLYNLATTLGWSPGTPTTPATSGPTPDVTTVGIHIPGTPWDVPNPFSAITGTADFLNRLWHVLTSGAFWLRVGQIILGFTLLLVGVAFMLNKQASQAIQIAGVAA